MMKQAPDAIDLLDADHLAVHAMLQSYRELVRTRAGALQRRALAEEICMELTIHARLEEELFYPACARRCRTRTCWTRRRTAWQPAGIHRADPGQLAGGPAVRRARRGARRVRGAPRAPGARAGLQPRTRARLDLQSLARALAVRKDELRSVSDALREDALASAHA